MSATLETRTISRQIRPVPADASVGATPADGRYGRRPGRWIGLGLLVSAQFVVMLDTSIVNVALPSIARQFDVSGSAYRMLALTTLS